jgi:NAD(P)-dependent dehydrogenase (short-subunit alcohol dehydrogenase family)
MIGDDPLDLGRQIAFVTGAGQGAGRAIALALAHHNAGAVAVNDFYPERAAAVVAEIHALGVPALAVATDVGDHVAVRAAIKTVAEKFGPVTLLVNNAGNAGPTSTIGNGPLFWEGPVDDWDRFFRTNVQGVMNCCHAAIPGMVALRKGRIVTIVSDAGRMGGARTAAYSAAKAAAAGFVRAIAREAGRFGITCNAVSLSTLEPQLDPEAKATFMASEQAKAITSGYVIRRLGRPEDVAGIALFLCSQSASWITGQTYPVNGGYSFAL